jgi:teichuronic acid biosynthesis glycosyltransferase TuaC
VGTKVGGIPEIICSDEIGLLCQPGDHEDLIRNILITLNKNWDKEKIREYGSQFTWNNIAKQIIEIYKKVVSQNQRK